MELKLKSFDANVFWGPEIMIIVIRPLLDRHTRHEERDRNKYSMVWWGGVQVMTILYLLLTNTSYFLSFYVLFLSFNVMDHMQNEFVPF